MKKEINVNFVLGMIVIVLVTCTSFMLFAGIWDISHTETAKIHNNVDMSDKIVLTEYVPPVEEEEEPEEGEESDEDYIYQEPVEEYYDDSTYYEEATYEPEESYSNGSGLTKQSGVNQYNGRRETYYSSNVLRHYRIDEWHTDENGVWRDSDGYVVVAADDIPEGGLVDTSFGEGKVYDCGVGYDGGTDIYTNW